MFPVAGGEGSEPGKYVQYPPFPPFRSPEGTYAIYSACTGNRLNNAGRAR